MIKERSERLNQICANIKVDKSFPLLKCVRIRSDLYFNLFKAINFYVYNNICSQPNVEIKLEHSLDYKSEILSLNNITPNGMILPTIETCLSYNLVHHSISNILESLHLFDLVNKLHNPVTVRYVDGHLSQKDNRPRSSSKIHSDIWAGEPTNAIVVIIPIHGIDNVDIKFWEPGENFNDYMKPLNDYYDGLSLVNHNKQYNVNMENGYLYMFDPILLHQTHKNDRGYRISTDFRFTTDIYCNDDLHINNREEDYINANAWISIGKYCTLTTNKSIFDKFTGNDVAINAYPATYGYKHV